MKTLLAIVFATWTSFALAQAPAPKPAAAGGPAAVQIGAFSSQALADSEWSKAVAGAPGRSPRRLTAKPTETPMAARMPVVAKNTAG